MRRTILSLTLVGAVLLACSGVVLAQNDSTTRDTPPSNEKERQKEEANEETKEDNFSDLLSKAQSEGAIRVIVGLQAGLPEGKFVPEGELSQAQSADQRRAIETAQADLLAELQRTEFRGVREFKTIPYIALELSSEALEVLQRSPRVTSIAEDTPEPLAQDESAPADQSASTGEDPDWPALASSVPIVQADDMWAAGFTGTGQTIAVLDTGVDSAHTFLTGKVVQEACYSTGSDGSGNAGNCPDGTETQTGLGSGIPCTYATDACRHGTHVAGIAAGEGSSFSGVARDANLMSVQVFSRFTGSACSGAGEDPCAATFPSDQIAGLEQVLLVAQQGIHDFSSVNMSIGSGRNTTNCDTTQAARKAVIDNLRAADIATAISSGNNGYTDAISQPACISTAVSVGSTTDSDTVSSFSNIASFLSLLAPGSSIDSSVPGDEFDNFSGTSMATPHVAGAWALLKHAHPTAPVDDILSALQKKGTSVTDNRPRGTVTKPRINIFDAATFIGAEKDPPTVEIVDPSNGATGVSPTTSITVTFSEKMDESTLNDNTVKLVKSGRKTSIPVTMTKSYDELLGKTVLNLDPFGLNKRNLAGDTIYQLTIEGAGDSDDVAVKDVAGNEMAQDSVSSFTTARW